MPSPLPRLLALLPQSDWRRLAAGVVVALLVVLAFGCGYLAAQSVGDVDVATSLDDLLDDTIGPEPVSVAAPQTSAARIVIAGFVGAEARPLCPAQDRAPPSLSV